MPPPSRAMLCGTVGVVRGGDRERARRRGLGGGELVDELAVGVGGDVERRRSRPWRVPSAFGDADVGQAAGVLAAAGGGVGDVGGDVAARGRPRRGRPASRVGGLAASPGRSAGRGSGCSICRWTTPSIGRAADAVLERAGGRPRRGSGPGCPVVPARSRTWQEPHFSTKALLAGDQVRLALVEPAGRQAERPPGRSRPAATKRLTLIRRGILWDRRRSVRARQGVEIAPAPPASTVRATPSHDQRSRVTATIASRGGRARRPDAPSQPVRQPASSLDRVRADVEGQPADAPRPGRARRAPRRPRPGPEWRATTGSAPAGGALGGDHAERLREGARDDERLGGRQQVGELVVLEPAGEGDARRSAARAVARQERRSSGSSRPSSAPSRVARGRRPPAPPERSSASRGSRRSRRPPAARPGLARAPAARPPAAGGRPWRRSACRRRRRAGRRRRPRQRAPPPRPRRARSEPVPAGACHGRPRRSRSAAHARARRLRLARRNASTSTPGRAEPRALARVSGIAAHRLSPVWREPTRMPRAPARAPRAPTGRKRGCGLTTYSSALPWILTA